MSRGWLQLGISVVVLVVLAATVAGGGPPVQPHAGTGDANGVQPGVAATDRSTAVDRANLSAWQRRYEGERNLRINDAVAVEGGYVLAGDTVGGAGDDSNGVVIAIDERGDQRWRHWFNDSAYAITSVARGPGGGVVVAGETDYDSILNVGTAWTARVSGAGERMAYREYGGGQFDELLRLPDGDYLATGQTARYDPYAVSIDPAGTEQWRRVYDADEELHSAVRALDGDGSVVITRETDVLRLSGRGTVVWRRSLEDRVNHVTAIERRAGDYLVGADNGTVLSLRADGSIRSAGRLSAIANSSIQSIHAEADRAYFGSGAGVARVRLDAGTFPGRLEHLQNGSSYMRFGTVETIIPRGNGFYFVVGTVEDQYVHYITDGYGAMTDQRDPTASLTVDPDRAEVGLTEVSLRVDATDNDGVRTYRWDFDGDGRMDEQTTEPTVSTVYERPGTVNATVEVLDYGDNLVTVSQRVTVVDTTPPTAVLSDPTPRYVATTAPAILDARGSSDNHEIATYRWDLDGDGTTDRTTNSSRLRHHFTTPGTHEVGLTVVDPTGHTDTRTVRLQTAENGPPNVSVHTTGWLVKSDEIRLLATTDDRAGTPNVTWQFPDGSQARGHEVYHTFAESGNQTVTVVATDEYGATRVRNVTLAVRDRYPSDDGGIRRSPAGDGGNVFVLVVAVAGSLFVAWRWLGN